jgi:hypothetical protein
VRPLLAFARRACALVRHQLVVQHGAYTSREVNSYIDELHTSQTAWPPIFAIWQSASRARRAEKSVIFVLEDFHLFMKRARPTTIYNLLDALQAHHVCAAVIGVSEDQGAVELMEKRARSRFSHRKVVLGKPQGGGVYAQVRSCRSGQHLERRCCA